MVGARQLGPRRREHVPVRDPEPVELAAHVAARRAGEEHDELRARRARSRSSAATSTSGPLIASARAPRPSRRRPSGTSRRRTRSPAGRAPRARARRRSASPSGNVSRSIPSGIRMTRSSGTPAASDELAHLLVRHLHARDAVGVAAAAPRRRRRTPASPACPGRPCMYASAEPVGDREPARRQRLEVARVEDGLAPAQGRPARRRDVVAEPASRGRDVLGVLVHRPAAAVADDEEPRVRAPPPRVRRADEPRRAQPGRGRHGDARAVRERAQPREHLQVAVGDVGERRHADRRPPLVQLRREPRRARRGAPPARRTRTPASPTSSGWPPLRRNTAGSPQASASSSAFEHGSSQARREVGVLRAQQRRRARPRRAARRRGSRSSRRVRPPDERQLERGSDRRGGRARRATSAPLRGLSDQHVATRRSGRSVARLRARRRMEDRRVGRVRDHVRASAARARARGARRGSSATGTPSRPRARALSVEDPPRRCRRRSRGRRRSARRRGAPSARRRARSAAGAGSRS